MPTAEPLYGKAQTRRHSGMAKSGHSPRPRRGTGWNADGIDRTGEREWWFRSLG